eukprot:5710124-Pyramimonas_sp.AAC.1
MAPRFWRFRNRLQNISVKLPQYVDDGIAGPHEHLCKNATRICAAVPLHLPDGRLHLVARELAQDIFSACVLEIRIGWNVAMGGAQLLVRSSKDVGHVDP